MPFFIFLLLTASGYRQAAELNKLKTSFLTKPQDNTLTFGESRAGEKPGGLCLNLPRVAEPLLQTPTTEQRLYEGPLRVRVYLHIIRDEQGEGGLTPAQIAESLGILEEDFKPFDIFFEVDEEVFCIDDQALYEDPNGTAAVLNDIFHDDGIDIYLFPDHPGNPVAGGGMVYTIPAGAFFVAGRCIEDPKLAYRRTSAISHEMGHCLGLFHTHHGMEQGGCEERVDRSNCSTCGDFVCDTPSDPGLFGKVEGRHCTWSGQGFDSSGEAMHPDLHNIMSYTHPRCMQHFTEGQGKRMRYYLTHHPLLKKCLIIDQISKK